MQKSKEIGLIVVGILILIFEQMLFPTMYFVIPIGNTMESVMGSVIMTVIAGVLITSGIIRMK